MKCGLAAILFVIVAIASAPLAAIADVGRNWSYVRHRANAFQAPSGFREVARIESGSYTCYFMDCSPGARVRRYFIFEVAEPDALIALQVAVGAQIGASRGRCRAECVEFPGRRHFTSLLQKEGSGYVIVGTQDTNSRPNDVPGHPATYVWVEFILGSP
jgi:hypothetical protein